MTWTWVEPFAGAAACSLRLVGGRDLAPPVAWMGGKRRLACAILGAMGVPEGRPSGVVLCDAGPWGWVWPLLLNRESVQWVAAHLREWASEHPRALWERLAAQPPAEDLHERAAQWLWLQARSASGVPIWWDRWRRVGKTEGRSSTQTAWQKDGAWLASDGRGEPRPAGARAVGGRWEKGHPDGSGAQDASRGQRGSWRFGPRACDAQPDRAAGMSGMAGSRTGGMVNPGTIADRIEAAAGAFRGVAWEVHHGEADGLREPAGSPCLDCESLASECFDGEERCCCPCHTRLFVYLDPPYEGATGYGWDCARAEVLVLARRWAAAGAVVAVSEAVQLELHGWHHLELTRPGGKPEWLTVSRAPVRVPERQLALFEGRA